MAVVMLAFGMLIAVFGFTVAFSQDMNQKIYDLCENYKTNKNDGTIADQFLELFKRILEIKELSLSIPS